MSEKDVFFEMVKKWTISDYHTQAIKSEVIIDMLISEFVEEMIASKIVDCSLNDVKLLAKEFPIDNCIRDKKSGKENLRNNKVDFLVSGKNNLYLVELKTSEESNSDKQKKCMSNAVRKGARETLNFFFKIIDEKIKTRSDIQSMKYFYTLDKMKEKYYGTEKEASKRSYAQFKDDILNTYSGGEMKIVYIELTKPKDESFLKDVSAIILKDLDGKEKFKALLKEKGKEENWNLVNQIIEAISLPLENKFHK